MVRFNLPSEKRQESRECEHCHRTLPLWWFLANPVMPHGRDTFCYRCRVIVEQARTNKKIIPRDTVEADQKRRVRNEFTTIMRDAILARDRRRCCVCGTLESLEVHHIMPISQGGTNDGGNLVTLCYVHHKAAHKMLISVADLRRYAARERDDAELRGLLPSMESRRIVLKRKHGADL